MSDPDNCTKCGWNRGIGYIDVEDLGASVRAHFIAGMCKNCAEQESGKEVSQTPLSNSIQDRFAAMRALLEDDTRVPEIEVEEPNRARMTDQWLRLSTIIGKAITKELNEDHPGFDKASFREFRGSGWRSVTEDGTHNNLVFEGGPGCGKTRMAAWLCLQLVAASGECEWVSEARFFDIVGDVGRPAEREAAKELLERYAEAEILFFDDMGSGSLTEARAARLFALFDYRYSHGLTTVVTTNSTAPELARRIKALSREMGRSPKQGDDEAVRFLRRLYGYDDAPLATVIVCGRPEEERADAA